MEPAVRRYIKCIHLNLALIYGSILHALSGLAPLHSDLSWHLALLFFSFVSFAFFSWDIRWCVYTSWPDPGLAIRKLIYLSFVKLGAVGVNEKEARTYMLRAFGISFCGQAEKRPGTGVSGLSFSFSVFDVLYPSIATFVFFFSVFVGKSGI